MKVLDKYNKLEVTSEICIFSTTGDFIPKMTVQISADTFEDLFGTMSSGMYVRIFDA